MNIGLMKRNYFLVINSKKINIHMQFVHFLLVQINCPYEGKVRYVEPQPTAGL